MLTLFLYPFLFKKRVLKKVSIIFSKSMFWIENIVFISLMLLYEIILIPIAYFKIMFDLATSRSMEALFKYIPIWIFVGPVLLLVALYLDMYHFFKILLNY
jgi:hypothetical protein